MPFDANTNRSRKQNRFPDCRGTEVAISNRVGGSAPAKTPKKAGKKPRKAASGQKEMLMPIDGKKQAKETTAKNPSPDRNASRRKSKPETRTFSGGARERGPLACAGFPSQIGRKSQHALFRRRQAGRSQHPRRVPT